MRACSSPSWARSSDCGPLGAAAACFLGGMAAARAGGGELWATTWAACVTGDKKRYEAGTEDVRRPTFTSIGGSLKPWLSVNRNGTEESSEITRLGHYPGRTSAGMDED